MFGDPLETWLLQLAFDGRHDHGSTRDATRLMSSLAVKARRTSPAPVGVHVPALSPPANKNLIVVINRMSSGFLDGERHEQRSRGDHRQRRSHDPRAPRSCWSSAFARSIASTAPVPCSRVRSAMATIDARGLENTTPTKRALVSATTPHRSSGDVLPLLVDRRPLGVPRSNWYSVRRSTDSARPDCPPAGDVHDFSSLQLCRRPRGL